MAAMTKFEDNLWREVEDKYGAELSDAAGPLHAHSRLCRPAMAGASLGVVGASTAAVIILTAASSPPAFAVTTHRDGTISVVIRRIEGIRGANRRLAELGIHARAVRVADGCQAVPPGPLSQIAVATFVRNGRTNKIGDTPGWTTTKIRPAQIPSGRTLVMPAVRAGAVVRFVRGRTVSGAIPGCLPPSVQVRASSRGAVVQMIACRGGVPMRAFRGQIPLHPRFIAPSPEASTVSTNAGPPSATLTETTISPATTTDTGTTTNAGTATTGTGTTTNTETTTGTSTGTTQSPTPARPPEVTLPPPLVRACRLAAGVATR
jgi:hypothetical protein